MNITDEQIKEAAKALYPKNELGHEVYGEQWSAGAQWLRSQMEERWVPVSERLPEVGDSVLIVIDVRKWDSKRKLRVETAHVGFFDVPTKIGGPMSLTGYKIIQGIYFAIPAIMHPEAVTHWMSLPSAPKEGGNHG